MIVRALFLAALFLALISMHEDARSRVLPAAVVFVCIGLLWGQL